MNSKNSLAKKILTAIIFFVFISPLAFLLLREDTDYSIRLIKDEELSDFMTFYKSIQIFGGGKLLWEKGELLDAVDFIEIENCQGSRVIPVKGYKKKNVHSCDINNDGIQELIIETFSEGAHCCFEIFILALDKTVKEIIHIPEGNASVRLDDLNHDGIYELLTFDDVFAYWHNSYADSPIASVVLEYQDSQYILANHKYRDREKMQRMQNERKLEDIRKETAKDEKNFLWDFDDKIPALLLTVMLDNIYTGNWQKAISIFRDYPMSKESRQVFGEDFLHTVQRSKFWPYLLKMEPSMKTFPKAIERIINK